MDDNTGYFDDFIHYYILAIKGAHRPFGRRAKDAVTIRALRALMAGALRAPEDAVYKRTQSAYFRCG